MKKEGYVLTSGLIFLIVGIAHLWRAINNWEVFVENWVIPGWVSWIAGVILIVMVIWAFNEYKK